MTDRIREQMSALLDGELPRDEMGLLVRRLERDEAQHDRARGTGRSSQMATGRLIAGKPSLPSLCIV